MTTNADDDATCPNGERTREESADRRDYRADDREGRADLREGRAGIRDERADERERIDHTTTLHQVENLVEANTRSNDTMRRLVENVRLDADMREKKIELLEQGLRATHRLFNMVGVVLIALVVLGLVNAVNLSNARRNAAVTAKTATDAERTYALLLDCLNTQGECGKRNTVEQKRLLDEIKRYEITVIYCARTNPITVDPDGEKFLACVNKLYPGGPQIEK